MTLDKQGNCQISVIATPGCLYVKVHVRASSSHMAHQVKNACTRFSAADLKFLKIQFFPDCPDSLNLTFTHYSLAKSNFIGGSKAHKGQRKPKNPCMGPLFWYVYKSYLSLFMGPKMDSWIKFVTGFGIIGFLVKIPTQNRDIIVCHRWVYFPCAN